MKLRGMNSLDAGIEAMKLLRDIELTQAEICRETGASRSHVSRVLGKLERAGIVVVNPRRLTGGSSVMKFYRVAPAWRGNYVPEPR